MKRILLTGIVLLIIIIGGVYLATRGSGPASVDTSTSTPMTASSTADASTVPSGTTAIPDEGSVTLSLGETAAFRDFLITPTKVVQDSRCPAGVYCIQAGTVEVSVEARSALGTATKTVKLGDSIVVGSEKIAFTHVDPAKTQAVIDPSAYRFTIVTSKVSNAQ